MGYIICVNVLSPSTFGLLIFSIFVLESTLFVMNDIIANNVSPLFSPWLSGRPV